MAFGLGKENGDLIKTNNNVTNTKDSMTMIKKMDSVNTNGLMVLNMRDFLKMIWNKVKAPLDIKMEKWPSSYGKMVSRWKSYLVKKKKIIDKLIRANKNRLIMGWIETKLFQVDNLVFLTKINETLMIYYL